ncbi:efflux RND transporter periplasmic adaptor subunit [Psychromonas aquimarina]|uniref:efflux RND transporter periplasmic adaptor subunit n=1 Tax=Psychromonas aquimarina TaxID=444919 RepID=UPI0003F94D4A|nr:efflux RND transporter periplasmic adaptor subunit [Psychromonas aquimarina]
MQWITKRSTILLFLLVSLISGCNNPVSKSVKTDTASPLTLVNSLQLTGAENYTVMREYVGLVHAGQQAKLGFELGGKIAGLYVDIGDKVQEGDALIILDTQLLKTTAEQLTAQQAQITAQLDLVDANLKRQRSLKKKGFSADSEIDNLFSQRKALQANYRQLAAALSANALQQQKSTIYAPYSGTISERFISKGDVVNAGTPTFTLLAGQDREAQIGIPAKQLMRIKEQSQRSDAAQQKWPLRIGQQQVLASLLNPGAQVDLKSRMVTLRFALPDSVDVINGELVYLQFADKHQQAGYWVPLTAMTDGLRGVWNVYALTTNEDNSYKVQRRTVQVLYADGQQAYISGAVSDNELLAADGLHRLVPGQNVQLSHNQASATTTNEVN